MGIIWYYVINFPLAFKIKSKKILISLSVLDSARTSGAWPRGGPKPVHKLV